MPDGYVVTHESHAVWSPDGTELAFVRTISKLDGFGLQSIVIVDPDNGAERTVGDDYETVSDLSWSPTGRALLFSDWLPNKDPLARQRAIYSVDVSSSEKAVLIDEGWGPAWIGDTSNFIAYY